MNNILYRECFVEFKHFFRIMRNIALALFIFVGATYATTSYSQTMKVTIVADNISTGNVIDEIERQTDYLFVYNKEEVNMQREVKVNAENVTVAEVLNDVFHGTGTYYAMEGKNIMLMNKSEIVNRYEGKPNRYVVEGNKVTFIDNDEIRQAKNTVRGIVRDESGEPIIGANITVKGQTIGTITNIDGRFSLEAPEGVTLEISYIGFVKQEVKAIGKKELSITLKEDAKTLEEVVVVGYGTMKRRDITGSVSSVGTDVMTQGSSTQVATALQGRIAGVNIQKNAGRPGGSFSIYVRGANSINNTNDPLYVIDGMPTTASLNDLNPDDIESIDVLKDASATAIYGSRGANGVVIITTKRGQKGKLSIQYDGSFGFKEATHLPDMMDGDEYVAFRTEYYNNLGRSTDRSNSEFFTEEEWANIDSGNYTDWVDLVLRKGFQTSNTLTISGGDDKGTFSLGIGQLKENGTIDGQDYSRYNMHLNISRKITDKWEAGGSLYFTYSIQNEGSYETLRSAYRLPPMVSPYDEDGNLKFKVYRSSSVTNPLYESMEDGESRENKRYRGMGNIYLKFEPIKGLALRSQFSPQFIFKRDGEYYGLYCKNGGGGTSLANTSAVYETTNHWSYTWDNQVTYDKKLGQHSLGVTFVQSIQFQQEESTYQKAYNLPYNSKWYNLDSVASDDISSSSTDYTQASLASFLGRIQYSYKDRYMLTVSGRYDGSSKLAEGNKWAFFPSAALAWMIGEEPFMKEIDFLSYLKLRLSYGVTGNDAVDIYGTQSNVSKLNYDFGGTTTTSYYKSGLANTDLTWEKTYEINLGIDFGFFDNRINGTIDLYQRTSKDLIMERQIPSTSGWTSIWDNIGKVRNRGIEISLNATIIKTKDFTWDANLVFDTNKNEILELYGEKNDDVTNKWFIGEAISVNYDYEFAGIWQTDEAEEAAIYGQTPGQVKVVDQNGDGVINSEDKVILGQQLPKWSGSFTSTFQYKDWDFAFNIYTRQGAQLNSTFVSAFMCLEGDYNQVDVDYWTESNPSNKYPAPGNKGDYFSAMCYQDVSFVRVGYITLGYTFPKKWMKRLGVKNLHLSATANNPFLFTSFPGWDPEWATQNTWGEVTSTRSFLFGIKFEI